MLYEIRGLGEKINANNRKEAVKIAKKIISEKRNLTIDSVKYYGKSNYIDASIFTHSTVYLNSNGGLYSLIFDVVPISEN